MRLFSILPFVAFAASAVIDLQQNEDYYNPTLAVDHSSKNPCAGQSHGSCTYNAKGNSHVYLGHKTNWGTVNPKDLIPKLKHACDSAGHCKPVSASGTFASKKTGIGKSGTLSLHVQDGIYADGQKSDLVDVVHRVVDNRIEHIERCAEQCPAPPYCTCAGPTYKQILAPSEFDVKTVDHHGKTIMQMHVLVKVVIDTGDDASICKDIFGAAGAVAGAVDGPAAGVVGGVFSLLSLAC